MLERRNQTQFKVFSGYVRWTSHQENLLGPRWGVPSLRRVVVSHHSKSFVGFLGAKASSIIVNSDPALAWAVRMSGAHGSHFSPPRFSQREIPLVSIESRHRGGGRGCFGRRRPRERLPCSDDAVSANLCPCEQHTPMMQARKAPKKRIGGGGNPWNFRVRPIWPAGLQLLRYA